MNKPRIQRKRCYIYGKDTKSSEDEVHLWLDGKETNSGYFHDSLNGGVGIMTYGRIYGYSPKSRLEARKIILEELKIQKRVTQKDITDRARERNYFTIISSSNECIDLIRPRIQIYIKMKDHRVLIKCSPEDPRNFLTIYQPKTEKKCIYNFKKRDLDYVKDVFSLKRLLGDTYKITEKTNNN